MDEQVIFRESANILSSTMISLMSRPDTKSSSAASSDFSGMEAPFTLRSGPFPGRKLFPTKYP